MSLDAEEAHHARRVLRLEVGERVEVFDGQGRTGSGPIVEISRTDVAIAVGPVATHPRPAGARLSLVIALPRAHRQQFLFEKATELGVTSVRPMISARSTVKPAMDAVTKWRRYCIEAAKQSGAAYLPEIGAPESFSATLVSAAPDSRGFIPTPAPAAPPLAALLAECPQDARITVWIGPEGGFTPAELEAAEQRGLKPVSLGPHVLRVETAALAVAAYVTLAARRPAPGP